jgi:hypothetical protein
MDNGQKTLRRLPDRHIRRWRGDHNRVSAGRRSLPSMSSRQRPNARNESRPLKNPAAIIHVGTAKWFDGGDYLVWICGPCEGVRHRPDAVIELCRPSIARPFRNCPKRSKNLAGRLPGVGQEVDGRKFVTLVRTSTRSQPRRDRRSVIMKL